MTVIRNWLQNNKTQAILLAVVLLIIIVGLGFYFNRSNTSGVLGVSDSVTLLRQKGEIYYKSPDDVNFEQVLESRKSIARNSIVKTLQAEGYVLFDEYSVHHLDPFSEIELKDIDAGVHILQKAGRILHSFNHDNQTPNKVYTIDTPDVTATVRGTSFEITVVVNPDGTYSTSIKVVEGLVEVVVGGTGEVFSLQSGQELQKDSNGSYQVYTFVTNDYFGPEVMELIERLKQNQYSFDDQLIQFLLGLNFSESGESASESTSDSSTPSQPSQNTGNQEPSTPALLQKLQSSLNSNSQLKIKESVTEQDLQNLESLESLEPLEPTLPGTDVELSCLIEYGEYPYGQSCCDYRESGCGEGPILCLPDDPRGLYYEGYDYVYC
jgi:hypothetical protein